MKSSLIETIERELVQAPPAQKRKMLAKLSRLLKISPNDIAWLKLAEPSFEFWDNPEDAIYDKL